MFLKVFLFYERFFPKIYWKLHAFNAFKFTFIVHTIHVLSHYATAKPRFLMNDFCLGIAWFCFAEAKNF